MRPRIALLVCLALVPLLAGCGGLDAGGAGPVSSVNPGVYPPSSTPFGKTYGEWAAVWWQWAMALPAAHHPVFDTTGADAALAQSGPVWYLAATGGGGVYERTCTAPAGKGVLVPIMPWIFAIPMDGTTDGEILRGARTAVDHVTEVEADLDGVVMTGLWSYRAESPYFGYDAPPGDQCWVPDYGGTHRAVADGYWLVLKPLAPGPHTLHFRAKCVFPAVYPNVSVFEGEVTYHLTVE